MDYEYQYSIRLDKVEAELKKALPSSADGKWIRKVSGEDSPLGRLEDYNAFLQPARELINRGGKRWRPVVMLLSCEIAGSDNDTVLPLVPVVEFPHNGSLIVDDIEDGAEWRRGGKAVHLIYGDDLAINAGNLLYFLPTYIVDSYNAPDSLKLKIHGYYSDNLRRLHLGQGLDILWHRNADLIPAPEEYEQMCRFKTGSLARMAAQIGTAAGGGNRQAAELLGRVCEDMGVGFQIMDDVMNLTRGNPGKGRGDDIVEGKKSLPVIYHLEENPEDTALLAGLFASAGQKGFSKASGEIEEVISLLENSGSIKKARQRAEAILQEASMAVGDLSGDADAGLLLQWMIQKFAQSY